RSHRAQAQPTKSVIRRLGGAKRYPSFLHGSSQTVGSAPRSLPHSTVRHYRICAGHIDRGRRIDNSGNVCGEALLRTIVWTLFIWLALVTGAEARRVTVGVPVLDITQSALFVARDRGYFQKEGLDVELILMRGGVANQALIGGNVEFTTVPTAGLHAALQGAPRKVVLSSLGAAGDWALRELIRKTAMDENRDVALLAIGSTATRLGALASGVVDAAMMTFPHNITAAESGFRELVSFIASDIIQLQGAIVTREALLNAEP